MCIRDRMADISVNREVTVLSDGAIKMPLIGVIDVTNQSPDQIQKTLNKSYKKYLSNPLIQVYRSASSRSR